MADWPISLQTLPEADGFRRQAVNGRIQTPMEVGQPKTRRRTTVQLETFTWAIWVYGNADYDTLETFFHTTLQGGTLPFNHTHPITGVFPTPMQFRSDIAYTSIGADIWRAVFTLATV